MSAKIFFHFFNQVEENHRRRRRRGSRQLAREEEERGDSGCSGELETFLSGHFFSHAIISSIIFQNCVNSRPFRIKRSCSSCPVRWERAQLSVCLPCQASVSSPNIFIYDTASECININTLCRAKSLNDYPTFPPLRLFFSFALSCDAFSFILAVRQRSPLARLAFVHRQSVVLCWHPFWQRGLAPNTKKKTTLCVHCPTVCLMHMVVKVTHSHPRPLQ